MKNLVKIDAPELKIIEESKALQIKATFEPMVEMLEGMEEAYNEIITLAENGIDGVLVAKAKRVRIDIGQIRIATENNRKDQKAEYLRAGKAIDGVANILKWAVSDKEEKLRSIEKHFENLEIERKKLLQEQRAEILSQYVEDADQRDLVKFEEDEFQALVNLKKQEKEDQIKAEKIAEEERIAKEKAEIEERKRIEEENARLKAEAEEKERLAKIEAEKRAKAEAEAQAKLDAERKQREIEEKAKADAYEAELKAERQRAEKLEAEAKAIADAKAKEEAERLEAEKKAKAEAEALAKAPIKNQLNNWVNGFSVEIPESDLLNNDVALLIKSQFDKFKVWSLEQVEKL